jgi:glyoxylase I family protein
MAFSHVALNCKDMAATEQFYAQHFGFQRARVVELPDGGQIVFLKAGSMYLELFQAEGDASTNEADGPHNAGTIRHLAFQVDDINTVLNSIGSAADIALGPASFDAFIPGWQTVWIKDPDGVIVEISQGFTDDPNVS